MVWPGTAAAQESEGAESAAETREPYGEEGGSEPREPYGEEGGSEPREPYDRRARDERAGPYEEREGDGARETHHPARERARARREHHPPVEGERSTGAAYGIATASTVAPFFFAPYALGRADAGGGAAWEGAGVASALSALSWGPSAGYFYSGNIRYALMGGLGRSALIGGATLFARYAQTDDRHGHGYFAVMVGGAIATWGIVDFAYLFQDVRNQNRDRRAEAASRPPVSVSLSPEPLGVTLTGSF